MPGPFVLLIRSVYGVEHRRHTIPETSVPTSQLFASRAHWEKTRRGRREKPAEFPFHSAPVDKKHLQSHTCSRLLWVTLNPALPFVLLEKGGINSPRLWISMLPQYLFNFCTLQSPVNNTLNQIPSVFDVCLFVCLFRGCVCHGRSLEIRG